MPTGDPRLALLLAGEAAAARLWDVMTAAGIDCLLIKGPVTERWLYTAQDYRVSADIDLLVAPADVVLAERALEEIGYVNRFDGPAPTWVDQHGHAWSGEGQPLPVDLHRRIWGCRADPATVWEILWTGRESMELAGRPVQVLGLPARAMQLATHVSQHEAVALQAVEDLRRALDREPLEAWRAAEAVAARCDSTSAFADGLSRLPEGEAIKNALNLRDADPGERPRPPEVERLSAGGEGLLRLARAQGVRERIAVAWGEAVPSSRFMRLRSPQGPLARRGRGGLILSYPLRWLQIARGLIRGGWRRS